MRQSTILQIIRAFFPVHILFGQLKYNLISQFYWAFLFLVISDSLGSSFGIPYLFFSPEYLGNINGWSFGLLGFSFGGFTMAFNTYSYIKLGPRYQFLATVSRPFFKFCINNALIPVFFLIYYLIKMVQFQSGEELATTWEIMVYVGSFCSGFVLFIILSIFYFFPTTREKGQVISSNETSYNPIQTVIPHKEKWYDYFRTEKERTYFYLGRRLKLHQSRSTKHLDKSIIENVFAKNRINASIFEILSILSFVILGLFIDFPMFEFPAAMSIVLLLTLLHMAFSAMMSWFHRWTYPILFGLIALMNYLSVNTEYFAYKNYAYGLDYSKENIQEYTNDAIEKSTLNPQLIQESKENITVILQNWKAKSGQEKPKLIILNTSGGGSRSALWTFTVLQKCDKSIGGLFSNHLNLITGASGGMVGAAYYREILLRNINGEITDRFDSKYSDNLGKDLLNKLAFSASTTDLFFRYQSIKYNNRKYTKDRGYAFEEHLHKNTGDLLQHNLGYYEMPEKNAQIPMMILSPTIVNDGRRILISPQSLSYITANKNNPLQISATFENIDYQTFFLKNDPQNMRFSSVLRANATFPFIMPMMTMPTYPEMQLMDAGIRDNYGKKVAMDYLFAIQEWIAKNTSGVVILEIRDTKRILSNEFYEPISLTDKITLPFGNMYNNFPRTQDFDQEQLLKVAASGFPFPVDIVTFNLRESKKDKISLSWHLTKQEKNKILNAFYSSSNQIAYNRLVELLTIK